MTEQEDVLAALRAVGIVDALEWAARSAHTQAFQDFRPETGHDLVVLGTIAHALIRDRQDRAFRCMKYARPAVDDGAEAEVEAIDTLIEGLTDRDQKEMPREISVPVIRKNLNGSPGWRYDNYQWFLASYTYGEVGQIPWGQKSPTKKSIAARMGGNDRDQLVIPMYDGPDQPLNLSGDFRTIAEELVKASAGGVVQLILAHAIEPLTGFDEVFLGRPRLNTEGGPSWDWLEKLIGRGDDGMPSRVHGPAPRPQDPDSVADAPVRLRPSITEKRATQDIKGQ
ncbi:hypothetical protein HDA40_005504 [Hamadaea flava]|uniref:Uncharacterized protein n=1 Tax=Hamadaea flava TaxID=1742688 RepID=A0ABV8LZV4_9ACTN|nr:hypothetical protein [Hamadaea flava]MCP2326997.1 hypothetical protein [Hamadaea flava]